VKYEIMRVYASVVKRFIMIDLFNVENQVNIEIRFCDQFSRDFKRRYDPFIKWLQYMSSGLVRTEIDVITTAFEKVKNADSQMIKSLQREKREQIAEKLYSQLEGEEEWF